MKKILFFIAGLLVFVSCLDKDLDLPIYSSQTEDNFFKNTDDLTAALTGVYYEQKHLWDDFSRYYRTVCEIPTDNAVKGGFNDADQKEILDLELFNVQANNGTAAEFYNCCQRLVMTANIFIKNAPRAEGDRSLIDRMIREAKFLRAFGYFHLAAYFGGMGKILEPLKSPEEYKNYPRLTQEETFEFILEDLKEATKLPKKSENPAEDMGRATCGAAYAFMAKIYLFLHDYENAKDALEAVISSGEYGLHPNYSFNFLAEHDNGIESVYEVQYKSYGSTWDSSTGLAIIWFLSRNYENGYGFCGPTQDLFDAFDADDPRITYTFIVDGDQFIGDDYTQKASSGTGYSDRKIFIPHIERPQLAPELDIEKNYVYIRYADVLLMYAEVLNELQAVSFEGQNANYYLNMVRQRARNTPPKDPKRLVQAYTPLTTSHSLPDITTTDQSELRQAILKERRLELALEGWRRFDLIRTRTYGTVMHDYAEKYGVLKGKYFNENKDYLLPISTSEIDKSHGVWQNNPNY